MTLGIEKSKITTRKIIDNDPKFAH